MRKLGIDHALLRQVRKFITGANVHLVKTWIFGYETSMPGSRLRANYERNLRVFVADQIKISLAYFNAEVAREAVEEASRRSGRMNEAISAKKSAGDQLRNK